MKKLLSMALACAITLASVTSLASCESKSGDTTTTGDNGTTAPVANADGASYTLHEYLDASPKTWNPHTWEIDADTYVTTYTEMGLVDSIYNAETGGYKWNYEMADQIEDVTASFTDKDKWGIGADETGRVWKISLNQNAKWEDGTAINAETYVYSMQQLLNPEMKNYRANNYYSGDSSIYGADAYYMQGSTAWVENMDGNSGEAAYAFDTWVKGDNGQYAAADGTLLYFSLTNPITVQLGGHSIKEYYDSGYFASCYEELAKLADENGYVPVTDDSIALLYAYTGSDEWGNETQADLANYVSYEKTYGAADWNTVGLYADGDYTLYYITNNPISEFYFFTAMLSNWIVNKDKYEAGKSQSGDLVATNYGTSADSYKSFGPYKLVSYETDSQFVFTKNENWYGWTDGKHDGQYQTTDIVCAINSNHDTQLMLFNSGKLDSVSLTSDDMNTYGYSSNLLKTDETYTFRFVFATDYNALLALQQAANANNAADAPTNNKVILSNKTFREAISFSLNRDDLVKQATAGYKAAFGLINSLYYYNVENDPDSVYRKTDIAKQALLDAYGVAWGDGTDYATLDDAYNALTGYDVEKARTLFQQAYEEAKAANLITDTDTFNFTVAASKSEVTEEDLKQQNVINEYLTEATKGTGFEGKVSLTYTFNADRYSAVSNGEVEISRCAWGGAAFFPFQMVRCYCDPGYASINEACGFDPTTETMDIAYDFNGDGNAETVTDTFYNWTASINAGGEYAYNNVTNDDYTIQLTILSEIEKNLIEEYHFVVFASTADVSIHSDKIKYVTDTYNIMYAYGGIRFMTYNFSDADWDAYVTEQGGTIDYTN